MSSPSRLRVGQLSVYFGLFDEAMGSEFREDRTAYAEELRRHLATFGDVTFPGVVDSDESGRRAAERFAAEEVDVIVFAPTMAAPPSYGWEAVGSLPEVPLITIGAQELEAVPDDYSTEEGTRRSLPVGLVMFTNVLVRKGRSFTTLVGRLGSPTFDQALAEALRAAAAAGRVRGARLLAIGKPISGYLDVEVSPAALHALGAEVIEVSAREIGQVFAAVDDSEVQALVTDLESRFDVTTVDGPVLARSARLAVAMNRLTQEHDAAGGTVNCHSDVLRWNPEVGITACLGVSRCSEAGAPFSCTGDIPTAIALILGKQLAGSALYCELYQLDFPGNWLLIANGGEGDIAARAEGSRVRLLPEDHYLGDHGAGTAVAFALPAGPATLISLSPVNTTDGWVLVGAEGEILDSKHHGMEGPNGMFRFATGPVDTCYARWCEAGATHHAAALPGHQGDFLRRAADMLDITYTAV